MNAYNIIWKKSKKMELTKEEIDYFVNGFQNYLEDYQVSAFLMAVKINGFTDDELIWYTEALMKTAKERLPLDNQLVDKHSTGGIGDKVSIILLPIFYKLKIKTVKISGSSLGYTGGTLDKLKSINNFVMDISLSDAKKNIQNNYVCILENQGLVPGDSYTYKLRDSSATTDSIPLIAASIMSKKLISGAKYIFIDLKIGEAAFTKTIDDAKELAKRMKTIAKAYNREIFVLFSSMSEPLGKCVGNAIEVQESYDFLIGDSYDENLYILIEKIVTEIYSKYFNVSIENSKLAFENLMNSKKDNSIWFKKFITNQKGDVDWIEKEEKIFKPAKSYEIYAEKSGYYDIKDMNLIFNLFYEIKMSRRNKNDNLDLQAGIKFNCKKGDKVEKGDTLITIYSKNELTNAQKEDLDNFYSISSNKVNREKIILGEIAW